MLGIIDGYNFAEMEVMKYYAPPASWTIEQKRDTVRNRIYSNEWVAAEKKDGFFGKFVKDDNGQMVLYSRSRNVNGEYVNKIEWVPQLQSFFDSLPSGTCLLGELYLPLQPGSKKVQTILGCLKNKALARQKEGEWIHFYIFDCIAYDGRNLLLSPYEERIHIISQLTQFATGQYVDFGKFYEGAALWEQLQIILANGGEGMVLIHKNAPYEPGKRPSKTTLKVKRELTETIDCVIMGANAPTKMYTGKSIETWKYWINDITNARLPIANYYKEYVDGQPIVPVTKNFYFEWAGSLKIGLYNEAGKLEHYGDLSGITEEILEGWRDYIGTVIEVGGMMLDSESKVIRHPRMLRIREDKTPRECTTAQLYEN